MRNLSVLYEHHCISCNKWIMVSLQFSKPLMTTSLKKEMNRTSISPVSQYQSKAAADSTISTLFDSLKGDPLFPLFQQLLMKVTASDNLRWNEFYTLVFQLFFFPPICTYAPISCLSCFQLYWRINKGNHRVKSHKNYMIAMSYATF